ncbi:MAG: plasmid pRiA4b ORF-3 family protein, partial [Acidimicrobiales bacterium]
MPARRATPSPSVHQIKVTLLGTRPPVWRRLLVPSGMTLADLHTVLQVAMGWYDCHLYEFSVDGQAYGDPANDAGWGSTIADDNGVTLAQVAAPGSRLMYQYDFGDDWEHRILVEKLIPGGAGAPLPTCVAGRRACPPEDCGGVWGYEELLAVLADPGHPEHDEMADWSGPIDPEAFDRADVNARLAAMSAGRRRPTA